MLETELKKLNANIEKLIAVMEKQDVLLQHEKEHKEDDEYRKELQAKRDAKKKEVKPDNASSFTVKDIQALSLVIVRKDRDKKEAIKAKLAEHDAKLAKDLSEDALQVVGKWLTEMKENLDG